MIGHMSVQVSFSTVIEAPPGVVWERAGRVSGINDELWPLIKMSCPPHLDRIAAPPHAVGAPPVHGWMLLFGVVPIERRSIQFDVLEDGRFVDCSTGWLNGLWRHDRSVVARDDGSTLLTDKLVLEPRLGIMRILLRPTVTWTFGRRHRRLRRHFPATLGSPPAPRRA
jgi:ligand-binding SRPBCC domain-containing protein